MLLCKPTERKALGGGLCLVRTISTLSPGPRVGLASVSAPHDLTPGQVGWAVTWTHDQSQHNPVLCPRNLDLDLRFLSVSSMQGGRPELRHAAVDRESAGLGAWCTGCPLCPPWASLHL